MGSYGRVVCELLLPGIQWKVQQLQTFACFDLSPPSLQAKSVWASVPHLSLIHSKISNWYVSKTHGMQGRLQLDLTGTHTSMQDQQQSHPALLVIIIHCDSSRIVLSSHDVTTTPPYEILVVYVSNRVPFESSHLDNCLLQFLMLTLARPSCLSCLWSRSDTWWGRFFTWIRVWCVPFGACTSEFPTYKHSFQRWFLITAADWCLWNLQCKIKNSGVLGILERHLKVWIILFCPSGFWFWNALEGRGSVVHSNRQKWLQSWRLEGTSESSSFLPHTISTYTN